MANKPRITIVGLGQIGTSLALAAKKANPDLEVVGHDKDPKAGQVAQKRGAFDKVEWNLLNACDGAGLIILAMPLDGIADTLKVLGRELPSGVIISDTASTKTPVLEWAALLPTGIHFVGGDPIIPPSRVPSADGAEAASADLFQNAVYCLTPAPNADGNAIQVTAAFVKLIGAEPLFIDAREHDGLITGAQHLPYLLAAALLYSTTSSGGWRDLSKLAGSEYRDATALAARNPEQQRQTLLHHREDLVHWIDVITETLDKFRAALERGDTDALDGMLTNMIDARAAWLAGKVGAGPELDASDLRPNFTRMLLGGLAPKPGKKK